MFFSHRIVYTGWPSEAEYQTLRQQGLHVAAFAPGPEPQPAYLPKADLLFLPDPVQADQSLRW